MYVLWHVSFVPQMFEWDDIMGCNVEKCKHVPSEGVAAFMKRAVEKADAQYRKVHLVILLCLLCGIIHVAMSRPLPAPFLQSLPVATKAKL